MRWLKWKHVFAVCSIPFILMVFNFFTGRLGVDPIKELILETGIWSLNFLIIALLCTPLLKWARLPFVKFRRQFGLWCAFYGLLHVLIILWLEYGFNWALILKDSLTKNFYLYGWISAIILAILAITSHPKLIRLMGAKVWKRIHWFVYPAIATATAHYFFKVKIVEMDLVAYIAIAACLLLYRYTKWIDKGYPTKKN